MKINDVEIEFSEEDRLLLKKFFSENLEFIKDNDFMEYQNIKELGNLYEKFINDNNLRENGVLMLFLAEIRYDQLAYKITANSIKMRALRLVVNRDRLNDTITKWYLESKVIEYLPPFRPNKELEAKLNQNRLALQKSLEAGKKFIVK